MVVLVWIALLVMVLCLVLRRPAIWYTIPLFPFLAVSGSRFLVGSGGRPAWLRWWHAVACLALVAIAISVQPEPLPFPFALRGRTVSALTWAAPWQAGLLVSLAVAACTAAWLLGKTWVGGAYLRYYLWPALVVLPAAGLLTVGRPLAAVDYHNVYAQAREALARAKGDRTATVVVHQPRNYDALTRHYFHSDDTGIASCIGKSATPPWRPQNGPCLHHSAYSSHSAARRRYPKNSRAR